MNLRYLAMIALLTGSAVTAAEYPTCQEEATNGRGYGDTFSCGSEQFCRKVNDQWDQNMSEAFWCLWQPDLITHDGQKKFWSGINLGNVNFLPFSKAPYSLVLDDYPKSWAYERKQRQAVKDLLLAAFDDLAAHGVNSIRLWLHIDGSQSPSFSVDPDHPNQQLVTGIDEDVIDDLKWLLQQAYRRGIYTNISLWSHDILAVRRLNPQSNRSRAVRMFTNPQATQAYIDRALNPLLKAMNDCLTDCSDGKTFHDSIFSWEVLNEPEGIAWDWRLYHNYQYNLSYGEYYYYNPTAYDAQLQARQLDYRSASYLLSSGLNSDGVPFGGGFLHDCSVNDQCQADSWRQGNNFYAKFDGYYFTSGPEGQLYFNEYMYHDVTNKYNSEYSFLLDQILNHGLKTVEVNQSDVLRFINRVAGAIHRVVPSAKVSVGSHSMPYTSDTEAIKGRIDAFEVNPANYYADDRLVAAGGDPLGTLDFYHAHGYPDWADRTDEITKYMSPFFQDKDFWQLDKPLIVGEYWNLLSGSHIPLKAEDLIDLYYNNYAGAWGWAYFEVAEKPFDPAHPEKVVRTIKSHEMRNEFLPLLKATRDALGHAVEINKLQAQ